MSRCLVTGHKGYIGSALVKRLEELGHKVAGIDIKDRKDILDGLEEFTSFKPEYIFHLACIPRVAYSVEQPVHTMINNVISTSIVLDFARKMKVNRVIYSGSSSVVGNGAGPTNPYGLQKLVSEMEMKLYTSLYEVDTVTLRYFNVYSPCQKAEGPYATAVANFMEFIRQGKNPFITGDGEQKRDMAHLEDVVNANVAAMRRGPAFEGATFDIGTGENITLNRIKEIAQEYFPDVKFEYRPPRVGDVFETRANVTYYLQESSWMPQNKVENGIRDCFIKLKAEMGVRNG
jgi:UDP-glucose 4-epimerase